MYTVLHDVLWQQQQFLDKLSLPFSDEADTNCMFIKDSFSCVTFLTGPPEWSTLSNNEY